MNWILIGCYETLVTVNKQMVALYILNIIRYVLFVVCFILSLVVVLVEVIIRIIVFPIVWVVTDRNLIDNDEDIIISSSFFTIGLFNYIDKILPSEKN